MSGNDSIKKVYLHCVGLLLYIVLMFYKFNKNWYCLYYWKSLNRFFFYWVVRKKWKLNDLCHFQTNAICNLQSNAIRIKAKIKRQNKQEKCHWILFYWLFAYWKFSWHNIQVCRWSQQSQIANFLQELASQITSIVHKHSTKKTLIRVDVLERASLIIKFCCFSVACDTRKASEFNFIFLIWHLFFSGRKKNKTLDYSYNLFFTLCFWNLIFSFFFFQIILVKTFVSWIYILINCLH